MFKLFRSPLTLALALLLSAPVLATAQPSAKAVKATAKTTATAATADKLDINTATPDQLKAFPGIGDAYAKRIIDGRPYTAKNQLTTRGILPAATYNKIKDQIIASRPKK
ncbi:MAG: helix-hairpin-helix domain-containing protein [Acidobacteriales bacterium]|nr:helix-hairpin-helix domain-containing protein [Terriglobales bacterium]